MTKDFREKLKILFIDKLIIGVMVIVAVWFLEDCRHQQIVDLGRSNLAGLILPKVADNDRFPNVRARLLSVLIDADAIQPHVVAQFAQQLIREGVSRRVLVQSINRAMRLDVAPFLQEAALLIIRQQPISSQADNQIAAETQGCRASNNPDIVASAHVFLEAAEQQSGLLHWRSAFADYSNLDLNDPVRYQLDSKSFLVGVVPLVEEQSEDANSGVANSRLYILARILAPRSFDKALSLANSDVLGIKLIGQIAVASHPMERQIRHGTENTQNTSILRSQSFVAEQLHRKPATQEDAKLLYAEVAILANIRGIFGWHLVGKIAIPLAKLFATSELPDVRYKAGRALLSMGDCGVAAESILVEHLNQLLGELKTTDNLPGLSRSHYFNIETAVQLLSRMNTKPSTAAMKAVYNFPESKLFFIPSVKKIAARSLARSGALGGAACEKWKTFEYFVTATEKDVDECLAAGVDPMSKDAYGDSRLHVAIGANSPLEVVQALLEAGAKVNASGASGNTPLHVAIGHSNRPAVIRALLEAGADLEVRNNLGYTPVDNLGGNNNPSIINLLPSYLPDHSALDKPLLASILSGKNLEGLKALYKANRTARYESGFTPLHIAAAEAKRPNVVKVLLDAGADSKGKDKFGRTPAELVNSDTPAARQIVEMLRRSSEDE